MGLEIIENGEEDVKRKRAIKGATRLRFECSLKFKEVLKMSRGEMKKEKAFETEDYRKVFNLDTLGPYSAMVKIKPGSTLLFLSGLVARDEKNGKIVGRGDLIAQTTNIMERIKAALSSTGASVEDIFYLHIWLDESVSIEDKEKLVDPAFGAYFKGRLPPCNVVMGIKRCYMEGALLEIEAWAAVREG